MFFFFHIYWLFPVEFSSVQSLSWDSLRPHRLQHTRLPCPSPTPRVYSSSVYWIGDAIQPSHSLSSPSPPAFNLSQHQNSFPMCQFFTSGGQSIRVSASASVLPVTIQDWFPLGMTGWISSQSKGLSRVLQHHSLNAPILRHSAFFTVQLSHPYMTTGKTIVLTRQTSVSKLMSLLFNMLSRLVIACLPRSKHLLISQLQSPSAVRFWSPRK